MLGYCDPLCEEAPLLPKLRGYFAKFLRESCLTPLDWASGFSLEILSSQRELIKPCCSTSLASTSLVNFYKLSLQ
uniref:Uncharacterized protein n=1 Tax=Gossypium raimondii TaxID=29730 RepID=A0A0D2TE08_GOSRA|nr:hypothetical protein B456_011G264900 [Gossypium raimondii]